MGEGRKEVSEGEARGKTEERKGEERKKRTRTIGTAPRKEARGFKNKRATSIRKAGRVPEPKQEARRGVYGTTQKGIE
jgi:hypothetical protein